MFVYKYLKVPFFGSVGIQIILLKTVFYTLSAFHRATDILMKQRLKENLPGPADYFCNSQPRQPDTARRAPFEAAESQNASEKPSRVGVSRKAAVRPPFLSTCARFDWAANADNGGNLALSRLAGDLSKETNEDLSVAKNQDCEWFVFDKAQSPCPWSYEIEKYNAFGKLNASEKNKHNVAFGSCAKRKDESSKSLTALGEMFRQ